jgi:hypothetical protein
LTATLYTFVKTDGTLVEINSDRIDFMSPIEFTLPSGVFQGTLITVDQIQVAVQNGLAGINLVLPSIVVPQTIPSGLVPTFPTVMGSSQTDPFRLIDRRYFESWTQFNSYDGMSGTFFLSKVTFYPPWADPSSKGNQGWANNASNLPSGQGSIMDTNNYNHVALGIPM